MSNNLTLKRLRRSFQVLGWHKGMGFWSVKAQIQESLKCHVCDITYVRPVKNLIER